MHDRRSTDDLNDVREKSGDMVDIGIEVIPVGIGNQIDPVEISDMSPHTDNIMQIKKPFDAGILAEEIMKRVLKGMQTVSFPFDLLNYPLISVNLIGRLFPDFF